MKLKTGILLIALLTLFALGSNALPSPTPSKATVVLDSTSVHATAAEVTEQVIDVMQENGILKNDSITSYNEGIQKGIELGVQLANKEAWSTPASIIGSILGILSFIAMLVIFFLHRKELKKPK